MKIHIISLLALLISSKVSAQHLDEKWANMPACWNTNTSTGERASTNDSRCISAYHICLKALEDDIKYKDHPINYYIEQNAECADKYGGFYDVSDFEEACFHNSNDYCHKKKFGWFHHRHLRNKCRREYKGKCIAIYASY